MPADYWAFKYVEYAYANNVVMGDGQGHYLPGVPVDRGQMAVFVARSIVTPTGEAGLASYTPALPAELPRTSRPRRGTASTSSISMSTAWSTAVAMACTTRRSRLAEIRWRCLWRGLWVVNLLDAEQPQDLFLGLARRPVRSARSALETQQEHGHSTGRAEQKTGHSYSDVVRRLNQTAACCSPNSIALWRVTCKRRPYVFSGGPPRGQVAPARRGYPVREIH